MVQQGPLSSPGGSQHVLLPPSSPNDGPTSDPAASTRSKSETQWTFKSPERYNTRHAPLTPAVRRYLDCERVNFNEQDHRRLLSPLDSPKQQDHQHHHHPTQPWLSYPHPHPLQKTPDLLWRSPASEAPLDYDDALQTLSPLLHPGSGSTVRAEKENFRPPPFQSITPTRLIRRHNPFITSPRAFQLPSSTDRLEPTRLFGNSSRSYSFASRSSSIASLGAGTLTTGCMRMETSNTRLPSLSPTLQKKNTHIRDFASQPEDELESDRRSPSRSYKASSNNSSLSSIREESHLRNRVANETHSECSDKDDFADEARPGMKRKSKNWASYQGAYLTRNQAKALENVRSNTQGVEMESTSVAAILVEMSHSTSTAVNGAKRSRTLPPRRTLPEEHAGSSHAENVTSAKTRSPDSDGTDESPSQPRSSKESWTQPQRPSIKHPVSSLRDQQLPSDTTNSDHGPSSPLSPLPSENVVPADSTPPASDEERLRCFSTRQRWMRILPPNVPLLQSHPGFYQQYQLSSCIQGASDTAHHDRLLQNILGPIPRSQLPNRGVLAGLKPGGNWNAPRSIFDLYTPRFVVGVSATKQGLCPICFEDGIKVWSKLKTSAHNYHMNNFHGISSITGAPFTPPSAFRLVHRARVHKTERARILQGKCDVCHKWIEIEGTKNVAVKVPEIFWWKHAQHCHKKNPDHLNTSSETFVPDKLVELVSAYVEQHGDPFEPEDQ